MMKGHPTAIVRRPEKDDDTLWELVPKIDPKEEEPVPEDAE